MSRFSDQDKREILLGNGADPAIHDLTDDGFIVSKVSTAQPAITNTPVSPDTTKFAPLDPQPDSPFTTFKKSAGASIIPTLLAGAGAGLATAEANPLAHMAPPYSEIVAGLVGMGLGAWGGNKIQEGLGLVPEGLYESQAANPMSALAGNLVTMPLGGFSAGPQAFKNIGAAAGAIPKLATGLARTPAETQALINVSLGTGLGAALPAGESLAKGETPDLRSILTGAATGMAFNEPNIIGRKLFGFHPTVKTGTGLPGIEDTVAAGSPVALNPQPDISGATVTPNDVSLLNRITGATWKDTKKGAQLVPAGTGTLSEVGAAETSAKNLETLLKLGGEKEVLDAQGKATKTGNEVNKTIEQLSAEKTQKDIDYQKALNELRDEEIRRTNQQAESLRKQNDKQTVETTSEQYVGKAPDLSTGIEIGNNITRPEITEGAAGMQRLSSGELKPYGLEAGAKELPRVGEAESLADVNARKTEARLSGENPADVRYSEKSALDDETPYNIYDTQTGQVVHEGIYKNRKAIRAAAEKRNQNWGAYRYSASTAPRVEPSIPTERFSPSSELETKAPIGTEFTGGVVNKIKGAGISPERTPSWKTKWGQFLNYKRGIKVVNGEVINEVTGQRVAGRTIKNKVGEIVNEIDNVKGKLDTDAHEGIHGFIDSIRDTPLYKRFEQLVSSSPEFQAINEARTKSGAERWTPEEYIATEQGYEFLDRNLGLKGETPLKTWWKDFSSHIKTKFGKGGSASPEDYRRILQYKFQYDKATSGAPGSVPMVNNQNTSQLEKPADKDWQVTVQPEEPGIPGTGYVQIDDITGGVNHWSKGPESLGKEGYNIPDFKKLPMGKYKYEDAVKKLGYSEKSELADEPSMYLTAPKIIEKLGGTADGKQWIGTLANKVNPFEMSMLKEAGIEDFLADGSKKSSKEVADWIRANGPKVKVETYGMEGKVSEAKKRYDQLTHNWFETLDYKVQQSVKKALIEARDNGIENNADFNSWKAQALEDADTLSYSRKDFNHTFKEYIDVGVKLADEPKDVSPRATSHYSTVSALPTNEPMPEWTATKSGKNVHRVDVVIPGKRIFKGDYQEGGVHDMDNTLGWAMIQYKTGPKGEKIAVIAEAQSRWGQKLRTAKDRVKTIEEASRNDPTQYGDVMRLTPDDARRNVQNIDHPLLRDYNRLILKSAIEQARKEGATHIVVSDAETAMMTEGHDNKGNLTLKQGEYIEPKLNTLDWRKMGYTKDPEFTGEVKVTGRDTAIKFNSKKYGWVAGDEGFLEEAGHTIPKVAAQDSGMRLNYDTILPKIAEELTGSKGERVSLGEHKNAYDKELRNRPSFDTEADAIKYAEENGLNAKESVYQSPAGIWKVETNNKRSNLIFRNADGTPKTDVSGRMYDISKTPEKFSLTAKRYSEQSELGDPIIDKVTKLGEQAFDDSIEAASYENELAAYNAGDLSNKFYKLRGVLSGSKLDVRNSEKSELGDTHYKASFVPFLTSRFDKIAENLKSPTARMVTDNLNNFAAEHDILTGRIGNELIAAGKDFSEQEQQRVYRYAHQMSVNGDSNMTLTGREKKLFATRLSIIQDVRKLQNELGLKVKAGKEFRAGGIDPKGYIFSEIDPAVANTWAEKPNSSKAKEYDAAYIKHMTDHGISLQDATQALHEYKGAIGSNVPMDVEFGALRKAAGVGLPWELIDKNFNSAAIRYARRASRDLAYFKWIQSNPKMLKALNLRDQYGKLPKAEDVIDIENIQPNAAVKQAMRSVEGVSDNNINPTTMAYARAANNTIMGVGTAARNILNMPAFIASYVQASQLPKVAQAISHMSESRVRAFKNNAVRAGFEDFDAAGYYLGNPNPTIRLLNRYSELARKYQGRNLSDKFEGEYYYSLGELLATDNIAKAKEGNKESKAFVKKFGATVDKGADSLLTRKVTNDDVERMAKAFVDSARGTYGPSGLPSFAIEGQLSPFFALSRFSIEKANTIWKDVVEPVRKGIYGPAIRYILGSAGVGYAIEALNEELANKRGGEPTVSEVIQSGSKEDIMAKVISTAQLASFAGIVSDGAQLVSNAARGKGLAYSNPVSFPLYTLVTDTFGRNIADAANAIKEGEDTFEVLGKLATVLSTQSVQTMRYLDAHVLHPDEAKRKEKFRDYNVWMQLTDRAQPEQSGKANEFKNLGSKEFKREDDLGKAASMIPKLVESAIERSKDRNGNIDPVKLSENFKSLKLNSYQIMPALEKDPRAFAEYYQHVNETQGSDKAKNLLTDFMSQREINKVKNSMVPTL